MSLHVLLNCIEAEVEIYLSPKQQHFVFWPFGYCPCASAIVQRYVCGR